MADLLTHLSPMFPFYTPWKDEKRFVSLDVLNGNTGHKRFNFLSLKLKVNLAHLTKYEIVSSHYKQITFYFFVNTLL